MSLVITAICMVPSVLCFRQFDSIRSKSQFETDSRMVVDYLDALRLYGTTGTARASMGNGEGLYFAMEYGNATREDGTKAATFYYKSVTGSSSVPTPFDRIEDFGGRMLIQGGNTNRTIRIHRKGTFSKAGSITLLSQDGRYQRRIVVQVDASLVRYNDVYVETDAQSNAYYTQGAVTLGDVEET